MSYHSVSQINVFSLVSHSLGSSVSSSSLIGKTGDSAIICTGTTFMVSDSGIIYVFFIVIIIFMDSSRPPHEEEELGVFLLL